MLGETPLHKVAESGCIAVVKTLLFQRGNPNKTNEKGQTPLHKAVSAQHVDLELIELFIYAGANWDLQDCQHRSPLMMVQEMGAYEVEQIFIVAGAKICEEKTSSNEMDDWLKNVERNISLYKKGVALIEDLDRLHCEHVLKQYRDMSENVSKFRKDK